MGREMCFSSVELATLAGPHDVSGVGDRGGPVETLPKRVTHEGERRSMWPQMPAWMSRISSLPSGTGMHRCKTPEGLRLCSSLSIRMKDLARLARRRAWARFEGKTPRIIQSRYWTRQSRKVGVSSTSIASPSSAEVVSKSMSMGSTPSAGGFPPERPTDEGPDSVGSMNSTEGLVMS